MSNHQVDPFLKYENDKVIFNNLKNAKDNNEKFLIWRLQMNRKISFEINLRVIKKYDDRLIFSFDEDINDKIKEFTLASDHLSFFVPERSILFQCKFLELTDDGDLIVELPKAIAQSERRSGMRFYTNDNKAAHVEFFREGPKIRLAPLEEGEEEDDVKGVKFEKTCFDISDGGLSFIINNHESKLFRKGQMINDLAIFLEGDGPFKVDAEILELLEVNPDPRNKLYYKGHRVCLKYTEISPELKYLISCFVFNSLDFDIPIAA